MLRIGLGLGITGRAADGFSDVVYPFGMMLWNGGPMLWNGGPLTWNTGA